ncbi:uncharacterized protein LOC108335662 isoform X2 [Vigna angularis]|uniref:uncharacterized protein LOC108335662 isoform X2 n=1 Tax=Phaseolus angularis TaxID=3914 RepID=UPI00080A66E8|nr:uncharacterized protein LOC108335662 isoform X2 [Vigna angularis]
MRGVAPNFIMPYHLQRQDSPGQRMGPTTRKVTLSHSLPIPPNGPNSIHKYVPYNLVGPSEISASPLDVKTSATSSTTLASALASADWKKKQYIVRLNKMGDFRRGLISNALVMDLQLRIQSQGELMSLIHPDHWTCLLFLMQTPLTCCSWLKLLGGLMKKSVSF